MKHDTVSDSSQIPEYLESGFLMNPREHNRRLVI